MTAVGVRDIVIDAWASLSHKQPMGEKFTDRLESQINGWTPNSWTGEANRRRLTAYTILAAYQANVSRHFLQTSDEKDRDERREYGDALLIVEQTVAHLLGESQEVVVPGAEDYDPDLTADVPDGTEAPSPEDLAANEQARALADRQEWLRTWADDVHLQLRLQDSEQNAVGLGDSAILLSWDPAKERVVPAVMDPGFYFPALPDSLDGYAYPDRVHFAWEIPAEEFTDGKVRVRRLTYQVTTLAPLFDELAYELATNDEEREAAFSLPEQTEWRTVDGIREVVRRYPWDDEPTTRVCTLTDATWLLDDLNDARNVDAFQVSNAETVAIDDEGRPIVDYDLLIDFLPILHVPNTPAGQNHYGQSSLARVLQLLDDIQNADTDAQAASATTGSPIIGVSGAATGGDDPLTGRRGQPLEVRPGMVWRLGADGRMDVLDTSGGLTSTREFVEHLLERLSINARLPAAVLGRLKPSEVPSGFAMQLSFGPLTSMIRSMRLVRGVKYPLMLKMVQRIAQANGALPVGATPRAEVKLGAYLPSDQAGTLAAVKDAYGAKLISLETAVTMLVEVGFPIEDIAEEIRLIEQRDYDGANSLADATGDVALVRDRLGLGKAPEEDPTRVPVIVPPASGGAGAGGGA